MELRRDPVRIYLSITRHGNIDVYYELRHPVWMLKTYALPLWIEIKQG